MGVIDIMPFPQLWISTMCTVINTLTDAVIAVFASRVDAETFLAAVSHPYFVVKG